MKTLAEMISENRRRLILQFLVASGGNSANEEVLGMVLREQGNVTSHDALRTELAWLQEQGLVEVEDLRGLRIAKLTQRGFEAADGIITVPGIERKFS